MPQALFWSLHGSAVVGLIALGTRIMSLAGEGLLFVVVLPFLVAGCVVAYFAAGFLIVRLRPEYEASTWNLLQRLSRQRFERMRLSAKRLARATAATTEARSEIRGHVTDSDELLFASNTVRFVLLLGATSVVFSLVVLFVRVGVEPGWDSRVLAAAASYNALFVVSHLTIAVGVVLLASVFLLRHGVGASATLVKVAKWVGMGTVGGVIVAALVPAGMSIPALAPLFGQTPALPSTILIEYPAIGAVVGYLIGLCAVSIELGSNYSWWLCRRVLFPMLVMGVLWGLGTVLEPGLMLERVGGESVGNAFQYSCEQLPSDAILATKDTSWLLAIMQQCGTPIMLPSAGLLWGIGTMFVVGIGLVLRRDVRLRTSRATRPAAVA